MASVIFPSQWDKREWRSTGRRSGTRNQFFIFNSSGSICETEFQIPDTHTPYFVVRSGSGSDKVLFKNYVVGNDMNKIKTTAISSILFFVEFLSFRFLNNTGLVFEYVITVIIFKGRLHLDWACLATRIRCGDWGACSHSRGTENTGKEKIKGKKRNHPLFK